MTTALKVPNNKAIKYEMHLQSVLWTRYLVLNTILFLTPGDSWSGWDRIFYWGRETWIIKTRSRLLPPSWDTKFNPLDVADGTKLYNLRVGVTDFSSFFSQIHFVHSQLLWNQIKYLQSIQRRILTSYDEGKVNISSLSGKVLIKQSLGWMRIWEE